jgi:methionyl-tRNA formyltransferase
MRNASDSEININKSIKSQFNLLRICDNEKYPAFFKYKNCKFILKIFKG